MDMKAKLIVLLLIAPLFSGCATTQTKSGDGKIKCFTAKPGQKKISARISHGILSPGFKLEATLLTWQDHKTGLAEGMARQRISDEEIEEELEKKRAAFEKYISFDMLAVSSKPLFSTKAVQQRSQEAIERSLRIAEDYRKAYQSGAVGQPPPLTSYVGSKVKPIPWNGDTYILVDESGSKHVLVGIDNPIAPKVNLLQAVGGDNYFYEYRIYFEKTPGLLEETTKELTLAVISEAEKTGISNISYNLDLVWQDIGKMYYGTD